MDLRQLRYFVTIIESGSLSKAADVLFIAQPSLSSQIKELEAELKTQLLFRSAQGVRPTDAGKTLYRHARGVLRQVDRIGQEIKHGAGSEAGKVAVGFPTTMALALADPLFLRIRSRYPGIHLHIREASTGYLGELIANGRLDIAVLFRHMPTRGLSVQPLFDEELCVYGKLPARKGLDKDVCPLQQLDGVPMVLPGANQSLRLVVERSFARAGVELNVVADVDSLRTRMSLAREGSVCTILAASNKLVIGQEKVHHPPLRRLEPAITRPVSLCWPNSMPPNSASLAVYRTLVELVRELDQKILSGLHLRPIHESEYELTLPARV